MDAAVVNTKIFEYCARLPNWRDFAPTLDAFAVRCALVCMEDDAMAGAGMPRGSSAIVMAEKEFASGDIVLTRTSYGDLIRRFVTQDRPPYISVRPDPEGAAYPIIPLGPDSEHLGRVIAVVRDEVVFPVVNTNR